MSEIYIHYGNLEDSIGESKKVRTEIDNYISEIKKRISNPISKLTGSDSNGYASTASSLATQKINALSEKASRFSAYETSVGNFISVAKEKDTHASNKIASIADTYIGKRTWCQQAGNWLYNTFCVDLANKWDWTRDFADATKWVYDKMENGIDKVKDWFKYGDGKYLLNIVTAVGTVVVSVVATCGAIAAIPVTGGSSLAIVIGYIGAAASAVGTIITMVNMDSKIRSNTKAIELSGNLFDDDDGNPGAARYYGNISSLSEEWARSDMGDAATNKAYETAGQVIDTTKVVADTTAFVCTTINSIGAVRDYRFKNPDAHIKGYNFGLDNIKHNLKGEFGFYLTKPGLQIKNLSKLEKAIGDVKNGYDYFKKQYSTVENIWASDYEVEQVEPGDPFEDIQSAWKDITSIELLDELLAN